MLAGRRMGRSRPPSPCPGPCLPAPTRSHGLLAPRASTCLAQRQAALIHVCILQNAVAVIPGEDSVQLQRVHLMSGCVHGRATCESVRGEGGHRCAGWGWQGRGQEGEQRGGPKRGSDGGESSGACGGRKVESRRVLCAGQQAPPLKLTHGTQERHQETRPERRTVGGEQGGRVRNEA